MIFLIGYLIFSYIIGAICVILLKLLDIISNGIFSFNSLSNWVMILILVLSPIILPLIIICIILEKMKMK